MPPLTALRELAAEPARISRVRSALGFVLIAGGVGAVIAALRGVGGGLARDNALRNPRRTAATASALMVGVAVATLFTVIGASLKASATQGVGRTPRRPASPAPPSPDSSSHPPVLAADLVVYQPGYGGSAGLAGFSPTLAAGLAGCPRSMWRPG